MPLFLSLSLYIYTHDYNSMLLLLLLRSVLFRLANTDIHNMCLCVFRGHIQTIAPSSRCYRRRRSSDSIDYSFQLVYTAQRLRRYNTTQERKQKQKRQKIIAQLGASSYKMGIQIKYNQIVGWSTLYMRIRFGSFKTRSTLPGANLIARGEVWNGGDGWQQQQKKTGARMLDPFIPDEQHVTSVGNLFRLIQGSIGSSAFFFVLFSPLFVLYYSSIRNEMERYEMMTTIFDSRSNVHDMKLLRCGSWREWRQLRSKSRHMIESLTSIFNYQTGARNKEGGKKTLPDQRWSGSIRPE